MLCTSLKLLLNGWTDVDEMFCVCSKGYENGLDSQLDSVGGAAVDFKEHSFILFEQNICIESASLICNTVEVL